MNNIEISCHDLKLSTFGFLRKYNNIFKFEITNYQYITVSIIIETETPCNR